PPTASRQAKMTRICYSARKTSGGAPILSRLGGDRKRGSVDAGGQPFKDFVDHPVIVEATLAGLALELVDGLFMRRGGFVPGVDAHWMLEHRGAEVAAQDLFHLHGDPLAPIVQGEQIAEYVAARVQSGADARQGLAEQLEPEDGQVFARNR